MTNVEALKEVYVALGGTAEDFTAETNDEGIALVAQVAQSAVAPELPKVNSSNNGQVLTVDGGKWKAKEPSGGDITFFHIWQDEETWTSDKTFEEIAGLVAEEKPIQGLIEGGSTRPIPLTNYTIQNSAINLLQFCLVTGADFEGQGIIQVTRVDWTANSLSLTEIYMTATISS
jgi:hypothetical protein